MWAIFVEALTPWQPVVAQTACGGPAFAMSYYFIDDGDDGLFESRPLRPGETGDEEEPWVNPIQWHPATATPPRRQGDRQWSPFQGSAHRLEVEVEVEEQAEQAMKSENGEQAMKSEEEQAEQADQVEVTLVTDEETAMVKQANGDVTYLHGNNYWAVREAMHACRDVAASWMYRLKQSGEEYRGIIEDFVVESTMKISRHTQAGSEQRMDCRLVEQRFGALRNRVWAHLEPISEAVVL